MNQFNVKICWILRRMSSQTRRKETKIKETRGKKRSGLVKTLKREVNGKVGESSFSFVETVGTIKNGWYSINKLLYFGREMLVPHSFRFVNLFLFFSFDSEPLSMSRHDDYEIGRLPWIYCDRRWRRNKHVGFHLLHGNSFCPQRTCCLSVLVFNVRANIVFSESRRKKSLRVITLEPSPISMFIHETYYIVKLSVFSY